MAFSIKHITTIFLFHIVCTIYLLPYKTVGALQDSLNILNWSLEQLMTARVIVSSPLKRLMPLPQAATAVFVLTGDDIRRAGYRSIHEALRLVPGLQVARIDANKWAVSSRGFKGIFTNKLLVLIDGRSVYTPIFSGVFGDAQHVMFDNLEQIEVIRGPGAALWGANAVNGIINIITRHSRETQNGLVHVGVGSEDRGFGDIRYGGKLGESGNYRVYGAMFHRDNLKRMPGINSADRQRHYQTGFRSDWDMSDTDFLTIQADTYRGWLGEMVTVFVWQPEPHVRMMDTTIHEYGGNILSRCENGTRRTPGYNRH